MNKIASTTMPMVDSFDLNDLVYSANYMFFGLTINLMTNAQRIINGYDSVYSEFHVDKKRPADISVCLHITEEQQRTPEQKPIGLKSGQVVFIHTPNGEIEGWDGRGHAFPPLHLRQFQDRFIRLHAGSVATSGNNGLVFVGAPGNGKTTLTLALVRQGFKLLSDDITPINMQDLRLECFPRASGIHPATIELFPELAQFTESRLFLEDWNGERVCYLSMPEVYGDCLATRTPAKNIFFLERKLEAEAELTDVTKGEAVLRLLKNLLGYSAKDLGLIASILTDVVRKADCYLLIYSELDGALRLVDSVIDDRQTSRAGISQHGR